MARLQQVGVALVLIGTAAAVVAFVPLFTGGDARALGWYLAAMLAPLGLGMVLLSFWLTARARARRVRQGRP
jgi:hypothetical protein